MILVNPLISTSNQLSASATVRFTIRKLRMTSHARPRRQRSYPHPNEIPTLKLSETLQRLSWFNSPRHTLVFRLTHSGPLPILQHCSCPHNWPPTLPTPKSHISGSRIPQLQLRNSGFSHRNYLIHRTPVGGKKVGGPADSSTRVGVFSVTIDDTYTIKPMWLLESLESVYVYYEYLWVDMVTIVINYSTVNIKQWSHHSYYRL